MTALTLPVTTERDRPNDPDLTFQRLWHGKPITVCCSEWHDEIIPQGFEVVYALDASRNAVSLSDVEQRTLWEEASRVKYIRDMDALRAETKPLMKRPT